MLEKVIKEKQANSNIDRDEKRWKLRVPSPAVSQC